MEDFTTKQMLEFIDVEIKKTAREERFMRKDTWILRMDRLKAIRKTIQYVHFLFVLGALPEIQSIEYLDEEIKTLESIKKETP